LALNVLLVSSGLKKFNAFFEKQSFSPVTFYFNTSQLGPGAPRQKFNEVESLIWTFYVTQSFSPVICKGFGVWGTLESGGRVGWVILVLRTFPELI